ncbi:hypothetical protein PYCCODRAFT_1488156 [Trametes coccinea BRFM310]|uniref:ribonuclease H n=1 Tax=Trametes coccinea (strain BRFM310) TaxID=1353009 RepID=A0A1Y2IVN9_TRAC3|nr:hypothetical protein PYCCODRAFT_1488156 [Trametes coccinea BRFM310]
MAVPPFAPLTILSDSKYAVDGLTLHLPKWEADGWLNTDNADLMQDVVARMRARSATTKLRWVKGHSGVHGNEQADKLAAAAVTRPAPCAQPLPPPPMQFVNTGVEMRSLTQRLAYKLVRKQNHMGYERQATQRQISQIADAAMMTWNIPKSCASLWTSIRGIDMRREIRDFWWKAQHDALKVGRYWSNIPGYEDREFYLSHIILTCQEQGQGTIWELTNALLAKRRIHLPQLDLASVLGINEAGTSADDRLLRILMTEAVHLIWRIRCERVVDTEADPPHCHTPEVIAKRWRKALNARLAIDQQLTRPVKGRAYLDRTAVLKTWRGLLEDEASLPEDWIFRRRVLVGMPLPPPRGIG